MSTDQKETVICIDSSGKSAYYSQLFEKANKSKACPFYYDVYYIPPTGNREEAITKCMDYVRQEGKNGVISLSEFSSYVATIINKRLGYPSPSPLSNIICRDKYHARKLVKEFEWYHGFNVGDPVDLIVQHVKSFPCMLKPTMLAAGNGAFRCNDESTLRLKLEHISADIALCENIRALQEEVQSNGEQCMQYMVEEFVETKGTGVYEYFMDVFVTSGGKVIPYSIVEEFLFEDGTFFGFVMPPVHYHGSYKPFEDYAIQIGKKLYEIGFQNQGFNFEFWGFPDGSFRVVEINPRIATPTSDLFEVYSENHIFTDITNLFLHDKEPTRTPFSVMKDRLAANPHDDQYAFQIYCSSKAVGTVSSVFNYNILDELASQGYPVLYLTPRDYVLTEVSSTKLGRLIAHVTLKGTRPWNEIVKEEKALRKRMYAGHPEYSECFQYPEYFSLK